MPVKLAVMQGNVLIPGDDRLDRELGEGLQPGQDREREALREDELGGFGRPAEEECREDENREGPEARGRSGSGPRRRSLDRPLAVACAHASPPTPAVDAPYLTTPGARGVLM